MDLRPLQQLHRAQRDHLCGSNLFGPCAPRIGHYTELVGVRDLPCASWRRHGIEGSHCSGLCSGEFACGHSWSSRHDLAVVDSVR